MTKFGINVETITIIAGTGEQIESGEALVLEVETSVIVSNLEAEEMIATGNNVEDAEIFIRGKLIQSSRYKNFKSEGNQ